MTATLPITSGHSADSWREELAATLRLAGPLAVAGLLQMAIGAMDVMFIARLGPIELAGASLAVAFQGTMIWSLCGLTGSVAALIAEAIGRRGPAIREVRRATRMAMWQAVLFGMLAMLACFGGRWFMDITGQEPEVAAHSAVYLNIIAWAFIPQLIANVLRSFVSALGRPFFATMIALAVLPVNFVGNYILVFGAFGIPEMGLAGAAWASVVTGVVTMLAFVVAIFRDRRLKRYYVFGNIWRPEWEAFRAILKIGTPVAVTIVAEAGLFNAAAFLMGNIGALELAAHTLALNIAALAFQIPFGIGQAAVIRVGYHFGAKDRDAMGRAGWVAILCGLVFVMITGGAMLFMPRLLLSVWIDPEAPENLAMVSLAVSYLAIAAAFQLSDAVQAVAMGALRGLQDTRVPMAYALLGYWGCGFTLAAYLAFYTPLAGRGIWIGLALGLTLVAIALLQRWVRREKLGLVRH
ncbi:MATE family efflux transporter [Altericroceibacterium endophyticum]|uniref:Multidrug-efflux transporter n=1 Tax=Altericroceibacterium endophyticum TaxID=1808508 RepID=A0A6I4T2I0_9SPHN|nr:MATE family efflux transporter [Altericroceibacterium endophyticum]MXO65434.1 MATE family efflux transporter [Altericroceibacterium endophyticum]